MLMVEFGELSVKTFFTTDFVSRDKMVLFGWMLSVCMLVYIFCICDMMLLVFWDLLCLVVWMISSIVCSVFEFGATLNLFFMV